MGLPFESYDISDTILDDRNRDIGIMNCYYWLLSASAFHIPLSTFNIIKKNCLDHALEHLDNNSLSANNTYYIGQTLFTIHSLDQDPYLLEEAYRCFDKAEKMGVVAASYMKVLAYQQLGLIDKMYLQMQKIT